jgi:hypothetical protein
MGCWPDMRLMYECLDDFAAKGVKIHISEATLDTGMRVLRAIPKDGQKPGDVEAWSPELAADFFEQYYTVAFSHPAMEAINYWDLAASLDRASAVRGMGGRPGGPMAGGMSLSGTGKAGMLDTDADATPRPLYNRLKTLIRDKWMTRLSGQVGGDASVDFRGFHGDYEIAVRTPDGRNLKGRFTVTPGGTNNLELKLTEGAPSVAAGR